MLIHMHVFHLRAFAWIKGNVLAWIEYNCVKHYIETFYVHIYFCTWSEDERRDGNGDGNGERRTKTPPSIWRLSSFFPLRRRKRRAKEGEDAHSMMCQIHIHEKATRDNNTKVQSSSLPSLSQEFVQSTKYTRSQFTAFICWLKWCQSILNSTQKRKSEK